MTASLTPCPACGAAAAGNFCSACGASLAARDLRRLPGATLRPGPVLPPLRAPGPLRRRRRPRRCRRRERTAWIVAGALCVVLLAAIVFKVTRGVSAAGGTRHGQRRRRGRAPRSRAGAARGRRPTSAR